MSINQTITRRQTQALLVRKNSQNHDHRSKHSERITSRQQRHGTCLTDQNIPLLSTSHAFLAITFWPQPTIGHGTETITNRQQ